MIAAVVLAHSLFGCCAHGGEPRADAAVCCPHEAEQPSPAGEATDSHRGPDHACPHDACQWVVQKQLSSDLQGSLESADWLPPIGVDLSLLTADRVVARGPVLPGAAPPVRLHLRVGVLLI
jgi:hypothetical protein